MSDQAMVLSTAGAGHGAQHDASPLEFAHRLHRLLRGRYILAIVLATLGGAAGVIGGYSAAKPMYASVGSVRIRPPRVILTRNEYNDPNINAYAMAKTQSNLIQDGRVIDKAMQSQEWKALGRKFNDVDRDKFIDSLKVTVDRDEPDFIRVKFIDRDRDAARVAVEQVLRSYMEIYGSTEVIVTKATIDTLTTEIKTKSATIAQYEENIKNITSKFATADLTTLAESTDKSLNQLNLVVQGLETQIRIAEAQLKNEPKPEAEAAPINKEEELLVQAAGMAREDPKIARLLDARSQAAADLMVLKQKLSEKHRSVLRAQGNLDAIMAQLAEAVRLKRLQDLPAVANGDAVGNPIRNQADLDRAKKSLQAMTQSRDEILGNSNVIHDKLREIAGIQLDIKTMRDIVTQLENRRNQLSIETRPGDSDNTGRIEIMPKVESPTRAYSDNRKKFAALGLAAGGGIPLAFVMLLGLMDRRVRYSDDAQDPKQHLTLLGILPYLPNDLQDPEQAGVAAHCVHQIRTLLQIGGADHTRKVFAITSPTSGDGKTSLAMSLGLSFAASGSKTLLIDFDLVGAGLTSAMNAKTPSGVLDAALHGDLHGFVKSTSFPRLSILPAGADDSRDVSSLSLRLVSSLIKQAKQDYDAVIIDTGPILGSLEASLVCAAADGTILTLGRGQQRMQAERAVEHLSSIGATFLGVVFNRAEPGDFRRAVSSASVRSRPLSEQERAARPGNALLPQMGPVARTVASHIRAEGGADDDARNAR
jgi:capsular exopolysaccharide synthesis family protein